MASGPPRPPRPASPEDLDDPQAAQMGPHYRKPSKPPLSPGTREGDYEDSPARPFRPAVLSRLLRWADGAARALPLLNRLHRARVPLLLVALTALLLTALRAVWSTPLPCLPPGVGQTDAEGRSLPRASLLPPGSPLPRYPGPPPSEPNKYTLLVNTFRRPDLLRQCIAAYESCPRVDAIHVVWSEPSPPPDPSLSPNLFSPRMQVTYHPFPTTSFTNRFRPVDGIRTAAVVSIDDDVYTPCARLDEAFDAWKRHPHLLVGFYPRATPAERGDGGTCRYSYANKLRTIAWEGEYSIVLTKAAFLHRDWLAVFTQLAPAAMRAHIDAHRNCEDIAMQMVVSHFTQEPPVAVINRKIRDEGAAGGSGQKSAVSGKKDHVAVRSECLNAFASMLGHMPLVPRSLADEGSWWAWVASAPWV